MIPIENSMTSCGTQLIWHSDVRTAGQPPVAPSATGGGRRAEGVNAKKHGVYSGMFTYYGLQSWFMVYIAGL